MQDDLGLNLIDFGARLYDPTIGRWNAIDPLAEEYFNDGTYNYVQNTPMRAIDPNGMEIIIIGSKNYTQQVVNYLARLGSNSEKGAQMVLDAINSKKKFVLFEPKNKEVSGAIGDIDSDEYETLGFDVENVDDDLDSSNGRDGKKLKKSGELAISHELSHFLNPDNRSISIGKSKSQIDEVQALKDENQVRREFQANGMEFLERTHHGGNNLYGKKLNKNDKLVRDKNYSVNVPGIGRRTFQLVFKYYTNMKYVKREKFYHKYRSLNKLLKGPLPTKQLIINNKI